MDKTSIQPMALSSERLSLGASQVRLVLQSY
jgi:hypothetical protein